MKNLVFVILIAVIPAIYTGCQKGDNIVEKLTPEPTLEDLYRGETLAILKGQSVLPHWEKRLWEVEDSFRAQKRYTHAAKFFLPVEKGCL